MTEVVAPGSLRPDPEQQRWRHALITLPDRAGELLAFETIPAYPSLMKRCGRSWWVAVAVGAMGCGAEPTTGTAVQVPSPSAVEATARASSSVVAPTIEGDAACTAAFRALDLRRGFSYYAASARSIDEARAQSADLARVAHAWASLEPTIRPGAELRTASALAALVTERGRLLGVSPPRTSPPPEVIPPLPPLPPNATNAQIAKRAAIHDAEAFGMLGMLGAGDTLFEPNVEEALEANHAAIEKAARAFLGLCLDRIDLDLVK